jgi:hypothetical protein
VEISSSGKNSGYPGKVVNGEFREGEGKVEGGGRRVEGRGGWRAGWRVEAASPETKNIDWEGQGSMKEGQGEVENEEDHFLKNVRRVLWESLEQRRQE